MGGELVGHLNNQWFDYPEKRAYDYIRFGRRSVPIEEMMMEKKMIAANKKASSTGGRNTYDYIRFGRRRRRWATPMQMMMKKKMLKKKMWC
jgi:hypothetical protein